MPVDDNWRNSDDNVRGPRGALFVAWIAHFYLNQCG